jgi:hypothetical protein
LAEEAAAAEVNQLYVLAIVVTDEDILWLQVAVDDFVLGAFVEGRQKLPCVASQDLNPEWAEIELLGKIVKVFAEDFEGDADVRAKYKIIKSGDDIMRICFVKGGEDLGLNLALLVHLGRVDDDFDCYSPLSFVVKAVEDLAKGAVAECTTDFVSIGEMVANCDLVGVIAVIELGTLQLL